MSYTDDLLIQLDNECTDIQTLIDNNGSPYLLSETTVDAEKLAEASEWLRLAKQLLDEAEAHLDEDPSNETAYKRKVRMAAELVKKAREAVRAATGMK